MYKVKYTYLFCPNPENKAKSLLAHSNSKYLLVKKTADTIDFKAKKDHNGLPVQKISILDLLCKKYRFEM